MERLQSDGAVRTMHAVSFNFLGTKVRQIFEELQGDPLYFEPSFRLSIARFQSEDIRDYIPPSAVFGTRRFRGGTINF